MRENKLELPQGSLYYTLSGQGAVLTGADGLTGRVALPETIGDAPVRAIAKKAFLSQKRLKCVEVPGSVRQIGEWAFACCGSLERVCLPRQAAAFGKGVFHACPRLREIACGGEADAESARLLAGAVTLLQAEYLLSASEAGTPEWLAKWDARMLELLRQDDMEGYTRVVLCGEEDLDHDPESFRREKRKGKCRLCLLRLQNPRGLSPANAGLLKDYLLSHKKGSPTEEAWEVVLTEHGDDRETFSFFLELGGMTPENQSGMLRDMGGEHTEMKAYLIRYGQTHFSGEDLWKI